MTGKVEILEQMADEGLICNICGNSYPNQTYLRRHIKERHTEINKDHLQCPRCDLEFKNLNTFWSHILVKHESSYGGVDIDERIRREIADRKEFQKAIADVNRYDVGGDDKDCGEKESGNLESAGKTTCGMCDRSFSNVTSLRRHLKTVHTIDWKLLEIENDSDLEGLVKQLEEPQSEFTCVVCNLEFVSAEGEIRHKKNVHGILPESELPANVEAIRQIFARKLIFRCKNCRKKVRRLTKLELHIAESHLEGNYLRCETCDLEFSRVGGMVRHKKNVHDIIDPDFPQEGENLLVQCGYCSSVIMYKHYKVHIKKTHNELYDELAPQFGKPNLGGDLCSVDDPNKCHICLKSFSDTKTLKRHVTNVHSAGKSGKFSCFECGKEFKDSGGLRDHLGVHLKLAMEPYVKEMLKEIYGVVCHSKLTCNLCQIETINSFEARIHVYIKHPEKFKTLVTDKMKNNARNAAFPCPVCLEPFSTIGAGIMHVESFHPEAEIPTCKECGHKELKQRDMNFHYQRFHPKASRYVCAICDACFTQGRSLRFHMKREHSDESAQCPYCPEKHIKVKLHVTKKHPEKASEYTQLLKSAIREECRARMDFNQLIDGSGAPHNRRRRGLKDIEDDSEDEEYNIPDADDTKVHGLPAAAPPPQPPPELYKMQKQVDKHLIEVRRFPPAAETEATPQDLLLMETDEIEGGEEEDVDVKPSVEELDSFASSDKEEVESQEAPLTRQTPGGTEESQSPVKAEKENKEKSDVRRSKRKRRK